MALATASPTASFDQNAGVFLDLSDVLADIVRKDNTRFLNFIGISGQAIEVEHSWMEDKLNPNSATSLADPTGVLDTSATTLVVASGHGTRFRIGTLFKDKAAGKTEVMQVTAVSTDTLTIVRGYGSTSGQTHGTGSTAFEIQIIAHSRQESQAPPGDSSRVREKVGNYTQIFQDGVNISYTLRAVKQAGVSDEFAYQTARRVLEASREMNSVLINGIKSASTGSDTVYRTMAGLIEFISASGGNVTTTSEALTLSVVNDMAKQVWDDGGEPNFLLVGGKQKRKVSAFDQSARRSVYDTTVAGYIVDKILTDLGFVLDVVTDPSLPDDYAVMGDRAKVKFMPLVSDAMRVEELAKIGRSYNAQVTGQYTCEVRNALEAFAVHSSLT